MFCVYLTCYTGNRLPPFYIGSTSVEKVAAGYHGTVTSRRYGAAWRLAIKEQPGLFRTVIISLQPTRELALRREEELQRALGVVQNPLYVNMAFANRGFVNSAPHGEETRRKIAEKKRGRKTGPRSEQTRAKMSLAAAGKRKSESHRLNLSRAKTGKKLGPRQPAAFKQNRPVSRDTRFKISQALRNPSEERRENLRRAQQARHEKTVVILQDPAGIYHVGTSLENLAQEHGLHHTSMMRTMRNRQPLQHGPNRGWQLVLLEKNTNG